MKYGVIRIINVIRNYVKSNHHLLDIFIMIARTDGTKKLNFGVLFVPQAINRVGSSCFYYLETDGKESDG